MPSIVGLKIDDEGQASTARTLLRAHIVIIVLGLASGIISVISSITYSNAVDNFIDGAGYVVERRGPGGGGGGIFQIVIGIALPFLCPLMICVMVRSAIGGNNQGLLQCVCVFDGCCTCCTFLGGIFGVVGFVGYSALKTSVQKFDCNTSSNAAACPDLQSKAADGLSVCGALSIIAAILAFMECFACLMGTYKANTAQNSLKMGQVFCGPPKVPQLAGLPVQGYGQPAMGQPVYGQSEPTYVGGFVGGPVVGGQVVGGPFGGPVVGGQVVGGQPAFATPVYGQVVGGAVVGGPVIAQAVVVPVSNLPEV